jgi:hypothetical protein
LDSARHSWRYFEHRADDGSARLAGVAAPPGCFVAPSCVYPFKMLRRWVLILPVGLAALFTGAVLVWRLVYDDAPWSLAFPRVPRMHGLEAFELLLWLGPIGSAVSAAIVIGVVVRWITGWRRAATWIPVVLPMIICLFTAVLYAPLFGGVVYRVDRIAREVEEAAVFTRVLALAVLVTMGLSAAFLAVTWMRHTPSLVRETSRVTVAVLAAILANLVWWHWFLPPSNRWDPVDWQRSDLLVPFRPCRGALVWQAARLGDVRHIPIGRIDDVWLHLVDGGARDDGAWAVSVSGTWRNDYTWLRRADVMQLRVRSDDPALAHCDSRPRVERVAPADWHRHGLD